MGTYLVEENSYNEDLHNEVIRFIDTLKGHKNPNGHDAHEILEEIYRNGGCYKFGQLLQQVFPTAVLHGCVSTWCNRISHVITEIGGRFYDITGEYKDMELDEEIRILTEEDCADCETFVYSHKRRGAYGLVDEDGKYVKPEKFSKKPTCIETVAV